MKSRKFQTARTPQTMDGHKMQGCDIKEIVDMSDDYMLLDAILDANPSVTVKQLAMETGLGTSTLYRYRIGGATIPSIVWRALWRITGDQRILALITGGAPTVVVRLQNGEVKLDRATIEHMLEVRQRQINCERCVLEIIRDGKIDSNDREVIERYKREFPAMIESLYQTYQAITGNGQA